MRSFEDSTLVRACAGLGVCSDQLADARAIANLPRRLATACDTDKPELGKLRFKSEERLLEMVCLVIRKSATATFLGCVALRPSQLKETTAQRYSMGMWYATITVKAAHIVPKYLGLCLRGWRSRDSEIFEC